MKKWISIIVLIIIGITLFTIQKSANEKIVIEKNFKEDEIVDTLEIEKRILAKVSIAEDEIIQTESAEEYIEKLENPNNTFLIIKKYCNHEDNEIRLNALNALSSLTSLDAKLQYVKFLNDSDEEIRIEACRSLMNEKEKGILPDIVKCIDNNDYRVRSTCAYIIGNIGNEKTIGKLEVCLQKEINPEVKEDISLAMAKLGDSKHIKKAYDKLQQKDALSRREALEGIKYIEKKGFEKELLKMLDDEGQAYKIDPRKGKYSRLKDASLTVITKIYNPPLSFEPENKNIYSDQEIEEVKDYLKKLINE